MNRYFSLFRISYTVPILYALVLTSAGCANRTGFSQDSASEENRTLEIEPLPGIDDPSTIDVATACEEAAAEGRLLNHSKSLTFTDPGRTCDWNRDGNLGRRDQWHQARIEQKLSVSLPAGSTLCHMQFDFPKQKFRFDDHFWFTFNDVILAASLNYRDRFIESNGLSLFDWTRLVGTFWDTTREGVYCLAGASCSWPKTDTEGKIKMNFRRGTYYAVTARDRMRNQHVFSFVTVGDNDDSDCQHRPVGMNVTLQYVK